MKWIVFLFVSAMLVAGPLSAQIIRKRVPSSSFETVTIMYTANSRGLHAATQTDTPASAYKSIISELRKENKDSLLVDLGNFMGATPTTILTQGRLDFQVMEMLGYDLLHVSNDDFVTGSENLDERISETKIPVLAGNLAISGTTASEWTILPCGNRKVGFIGLTSPNFKELVIENMRKGVTIDPASAYIAKAIDEMAGKADIVVALTDLSENEIAQIRDIPGLDLIITTGGDAVKPGEDWLSVGFPGKKNAAVARTLSSDPAVHLLEIHGYADRDKWTVDEIIGDVYRITKNTPRENATDHWFQWQMDNYVRINNKVIGILKEPLSNDDGRVQQTALGKAVTDIMRNESKAHLAIVNSGALRNGLPKGQITEWDLIEAVPYPNNLVVIELTGAQIEAVIAKSQSKSGEGGYLQFSGLTTEPAELGDRIGGLKIVPERIYTVILLDLLAQAGEGYDELKNAKIVEKIPKSLQDLCREAFRKYGSIEVPGLRMDRESNFWYAKFRIGVSGSGFVADASNFRFYPNETTLVGEQLITSTLDSRLDVVRMDYSSGLENFVEVNYGVSWDKNWAPVTALDSLQFGTQYSFYLSNLLFGGKKTLDPYVSAIMETVLVYPDSTNIAIDPGLPRPGSLKLAAGVELTLLKVISLKLGSRWENEPFDWNAPAITGLESILAFKVDIFKDILTFDTSTDVFSAFDFVNQGVTISSVNNVSFALKDNLAIGPHLQLFYNTLVGHLSYFFTVSLSFSAHT